VKNGETVSRKQLAGTVVAVLTIFCLLQLVMGQAAGQNVAPPSVKSDGAGQRTVARSASGLTGRTIVIPLHGTTKETVQADIAASLTIPLWSYTTTSSRDGGTYSGTMVGASPFASSNTSTSVNTQIVPLIIHMLSDGGTFDPTLVDNCASPALGTSDVDLFQNSPIILNHAYSMNGVSVGTTQYVDAFQRASFWSLVNGQDYHVLLSPVTTLAAVTVNVPASMGSTFTVGGCQTVGIVDVDWMQTYLEGTLIPSLAGQGVNATSFPIIFLGNVVMASPFVPASPTSNCCILGYHSAFGSPVQTYGIADFDTSGFFDGDVSTMSHEVAEWMNDPMGTNPVPSWGHIGQQSNCQGNLEVGDPLSGTLFTNTLMPNGYTYHLQEMAFFSWFLGSPSLAAGSMFSNNGTFVGQAHTPCGPPGTNPAPPTITAQPASQTINSGTTAGMSVVAAHEVGGTGGTFTYQWFVGASGVTTSPIGGATVSSFTTPPLLTTTNYWVRVKDGNGTVYSNTAAITVAPPAITTQPLSQVIAFGTMAALSVAASGSGLSYQWYAGASGVTTNPVGANSSSYTTTALTNNTRYWVRVSNANGSADSATAQISVAFTDSALTAGTSMIKALHITELRTRINGLRARYSLAPVSFTDPTLTAGTTMIRALHIVELRTALGEVYTAAGATPPTYTDPSLAAGLTVKAVHIAELRAAVPVLE
jgi:hypothetical protein